MAEGARLELVYRLTPIEGSNPSLSAILDLKKTLEFLLRRFFMPAFCKESETPILVRQIIGNNLNREGAAKRLNTGMMR